MIANGSQCQLNPFMTDRLLPTLWQLNQRTGPVHAAMVADFVGCAERTARLYLNKLQQAGMVQRPNGPRNGWLAVQAVA